MAGVESALHLDVKFNDGATLLLHIPLGRSTEERDLIEELFTILLRSWVSAYHPDPCPLCRGSGSAWQLPTLEELLETSKPMTDVEDAVKP